MKAWLVALIALTPLAGLAQTSENDRLEQMRGALNNRVTSQGDIWFDDGEFLRVVQTYKVRAELLPHYEEAWTDLIYMLFNVQAYEQELDFAIRYRELNADKADAYIPEASIYSRIGTKAWAKAIPLLEKSIAMTPPPHKNAFVVLGADYKRLGMLEDAIRVYKALLAVYPDDEPAKANLRNVEAALKKKLGGS
jgi:tetratricopeptide (TPR) repeat protein